MLNKYLKLQFFYELMIKMENLFKYNSLAQFSVLLFCFPHEEHGKCLLVSNGYVIHHLYFLIYF